MIPTIEGMEAVCMALVRNYDEKRPPTEFLMTLLGFCLGYNYFKFERSYYLQTSGTSMGSNIAPSFANLYMPMYEETYILPRYKDEILCYYRFIDDLFLIWKKDAESLSNCVEFLNGLNTPIKFTCTASTEQVNFLDITVINNNGKLSTTNYRKPTDRNTLLLRSSCHPKHILNSVPYSQMVRILRNNDNRDTGLEQMEELITRFKERGYNEQDLRTHAQRACALSQDELF
ncbi:uncharacterized protein WCC33_009731 [Rhinophrynus dorsalis]